MASVVANAVRAPDIVLAPVLQPRSGLELGFDPWGIQILTLSLDGDGHLWVTDGGSVTRIDDVAAIDDGTYDEYLPGAQIQTEYAFRADPDDYNIFSPRSAAVAPDGALYVGNGDNGVVGRFDDAASLSGVVHGQPQGRFAVPGVDFLALIGLDAGGDLWVARNDVLVRITNPGSVAEKATAPIATTVVYPPGFGSYPAGGLTFVTLP